MTPNQFLKYVIVYTDKEESAMKMMDSQNFILGKYIAIAVNDPKNYPDKPLLSDKEVSDEQEEVKEQDVEDMEKEMIRMTILFGGELQ